jgi:hypothetical protein
LAFEQLGIEPIRMSDGEVESPDAGDPARLLRIRYREAAEPPTAISWFYMPIFSMRGYYIKNLLKEVDKILCMFAIVYIAQTKQSFKSNA